MTRRPFLALGGLLAFASPLLAAPESLVLAGTIANTTQDVAAPGRFELTLDGGTIRGFLILEAPLLAGRWPVDGTRRGAWCEIVCRLTPTTRMVFRGVLGPADLRGTYVSGGGGEILQYGRFQTAIVPPKTPPSPGQRP